MHECIYILCACYLISVQGICKIIRKEEIKWNNIMLFTSIHEVHGNIWTIQNQNHNHGGHTENENIFCLNRYKTKQNKYTCANKLFTNAAIPLCTCVIMFIALRDLFNVKHRKLSCIKIIRKISTWKRNLNKVVTLLLF